MFLVDEIKIRLGGPLLTVYGFKVENEELDESHHVSVIVNDQVYIPVLQLKGDTLPTIERQVVKGLVVHIVDVFSKHPEATGKSSIDETLNVGQFTTTFALKF